MDTDADQLILISNHSICFSVGGPLFLHQFIISHNHNSIFLQGNCDGDDGFQPPPPVPLQRTTPSTLCDQWRKVISGFIGKWGEIVIMIRTPRGREHGEWRELMVMAISSSSSLFFLPLGILLNRRENLFSPTFNFLDFDHFDQFLAFLHLFKIFFLVNFGKEASPWSRKFFGEKIATSRANHLDLGNLRHFVFYNHTC